MTSQQKQVLIGAFFVVLIIVIGLVLAVFSNSSSTSISHIPTVPVQPTDHIRGATSSPVSVIEYGDFECPACGAYEPIVEQLEKAYGSKVTFVFRQYPLYQIHQNAMISAQASEAAGLQGKFWEMHDLLYAHQDAWVNLSGDALTKQLDTYASSIGLSLDTFNTDLVASSTIALVTAQHALGDQAQLDHTPTFFVDLIQIPNPNSYEQFASYIDAAIASSTHQ